jgi:hypothetical protein
MRYSISDLCGRSTLSFKESDYYPRNGSEIALFEYPQPERTIVRY